MFIAPLRAKVTTSAYSTEFSQVFLDWASASLEGEYKIIMEKDDGIKLVFISEDDMTSYLLSWTEEPSYHLNNVILPIIRRVMPNIIAQDIIGVQPMTAPSASIFALKAKYFDKDEP